MNRPYGAQPGPPLTPHGTLGVVTGSVFLLGAILGPGVLALPALAADAAGPASLVAWGALLLGSIPVAATFAALGGEHPDGGGVAHFAGLAFGRRAGAPVGWWFLAAVPIGVVAAALMGGHYIAAVLGGGEATAQAAGLTILAVAFATNAIGLSATGRAQVVTAGALVVVLLLAVTTSAHRVHAAAFAPFAPYGWTGVGRAASVLFFAFAGWEAATHLSADFADPRRGLRRATAVTLVVVSVLYLGLAVTTIGTLGPAAATTPVPLLRLLQGSFGTAGSALTATVAVLLTFGAVSSYLAGAARLGAALGRDHALPRLLVGATQPGREPRHALAFLAVCSTLATVPVLAGVWSLDVLVRATSALLAAVTLTGTLAGVRLLRERRRGLAVGASVFLTGVLACAGSMLLVPLLVGALALAYARTRERRPAASPTDAVFARTAPCGGDQL
ncbi:amino acid permease [Nocardioides nematodiphilus]|uniref:amino acid permease n=1 Tax=Nocardioides nematodiphilus TaxID=2849669 RepID=UPI001CD9427B|nr:amino acid permease [Nocardioides nematodiphilus]MCA1982195.1 amino acid permease [Nocardioides nematodiphilus]